jgi:hypothetical protein
VNVKNLIPPTSFQVLHVEEEEIIFVGAYKDFKLGIRFAMDGASELDAAYALGYISERIEEPAFHLSGINIPKIRSFAKPNGKGLGAVISFLEANPQAKIKQALLDGIKDPLLLPAAESFFFNQLLQEAGVPYTIKENLISSNLKPEDEPIEDQIAFIGNTKGWITIKKLSLEEVKDYEVSAILSGITNTIINKAFDFSGCKKNDELVDEVASGRKSFGNLLNALRKLETENPKLGTENRLDDAYLVCKVFEKIGYKPYPSPDMLSKAHSDIKPPKVKGRKPKG